MKNALLIVAFAVTAGASAGCFGYERQSTLGPTASGIGALLGSWTSSNLIPGPDACSDFRWDVTEQTATTASGSFSASCAGDLRLSGTARGTLTGSNISWSATGNASAPGLPSCAINLTGTAELGVDSIRVPYTGTTCLGAVSGTEVLRKR
jgi:hypothetical protein